MVLLLYICPSIVHNFEAALSASAQHSSLSAAKTGFNLQNIDRFVTADDPIPRSRYRRLERGEAVRE